MIWNVLADESTPDAGSNWLFYVILAALVVLVVVWLVFSGRKNSARQKEYTEQLDAIRPGNKVKSTGGLCGVVVEVCDDNTVIIETGSEKSGKSYFKLSKECIYQTDAKGPTQIAREEAEARRKQAKEGTPAPSAPAEETAEEQAPETDTAPEETAPADTEEQKTE